ncbi:hypothetical protein [Dendronalium sp. ChiSLP03b]|uniref:hypothetical protein n=1 Tax=Dendronalium sp. ChiSLP03b TaxID=3075381 RepID=UPI002AD25FE4|nr:hypothetical protein [Dendronalium sp. ChiSLP03b]MDZ8207249.1 hypothetical protein [Dendronalium sp. ChiSLP03b]
MAKVKGKLSPASHLGVACKTREEVDCLCNEAQLEALLLEGPNDWGHPVRYWAFIRDPDGHTLEFPMVRRLVLQSRKLAKKRNTILD